MYAFIIREMNKNGYENGPNFLQTETVEAWKGLMVEKYGDLNLDMKKHESGELNTEALAPNWHIHISFEIIMGHMGLR